MCQDPLGPHRGCGDVNVLDSVLKTSRKGLAVPAESQSSQAQLGSHQVRNLGWWGPKPTGHPEMVLLGTGRLKLKKLEPKWLK